MSYISSEQRRLLWRALVYVASAIVLLAAYLGLSLLMGLIFPKAEVYTLVATFILIILAVVFLEPLQNLFQRLIEGGNVIPYTKRGAVPPMDNMLVKLGQATSLDTLTVELTNVLRQNMGVTFAAFALYSEVKRIEDEVRNFDYIKYSGESKYEPLSRRLVFRPIQEFNRPEIAQADGESSQAGLVMKLKIGATQRGLLCVGPHLDRSEFKPEDFELLEVLAGPLSVMILSTFRIRELEKKIDDLEKKIGEQQGEYNKLKQGREELQLLNQKLVQDSEEQRNSLVRELQKGPVDKLHQIIKNLEAYSYDLNEREELIWHLAQEADKELTTINTRLRPISLDKLGLVAAINRLIEDTRQGVKLSINFKVGPELEVRRLPQEVELSLYRVAQEALRNVQEHARAQHVTISLGLNEATEMVRLAILDDGIGFNPPAQFAASSDSDNLGLAGLQERVTSLNGRLKVRSSPGAGALIEAEVPLKRSQANIG
jgi:signal transduction histidine kinase